MALLDLLGRRWAMRILWELGQRPSSFRELQAACGKVSSSVLNTRLAELKESGLIELADSGYQLSGQGRTLMRLMAPLRSWAQRWGAELGLAEAPD